jgi:type IV secretion system protein VirD4
VRLVLNQIGRRLTENPGCDPGASRRRLLLMLDEFPALGRLDFFETALAFLAGYGIRAFLIAQSLNQVARAYGENNSILDNCHVRIAFASNDERTARRISDALGTATEQRAMRNYAGHRLAPWLAHVMVSRQETSRPLLTPGEVMQLPPSDELVLVSGLAPIRARKLRYFADLNFKERLLPPPPLDALRFADRPPGRSDDWTGRTAPKPVQPDLADPLSDECSGGLQKQRSPAIAQLPQVKHRAPEQLDFLDPALDAADAALHFPPIAAPGPVVAAHAANDGSTGRDDPVPSF